MILAQFILLAAAIYALCGLMFGVLFASRWVRLIDHATIGARWRFRLIILPGAAALWPILLSKCFTARRDHGKKSNP